MRDRGEDFKAADQVQHNDLGANVQRMDQQEQKAPAEQLALNAIGKTVGQLSQKDLGAACEQLADSGLDLTKMSARLQTANLSDDQSERMSKMIKRAQALQISLPCAYHY